MINQVRQFELAILRPLQLAFFAAAIIAGFTRHWFWLGGCVLAFLYLGTVGSKLHPFQTASELASGPLTNPAADREAALLSPGAKSGLVGVACTRIGILLGFAAGLVFWFALDWRWYFALPAAWLVLMFSGAFLKVAFRAI